GTDAVARTARRALRSWRFGLFWRHREQFASVRNVFRSVAAGEQSIVSDAMEALWQHVDQEASDELLGRQRHRLVAARPLDPSLYLKVTLFASADSSRRLEIAMRWV